MLNRIFKLSPRSATMTHWNSASGITVPGPIADELVELNDESLRNVISYAQILLSERLSPTERLEEAPGEEIVHIQEQDGYTLVTKKQPCFEECDDCPHGPYLYRVQVERSVAGEEPTLHWSFLGRVEESDSQR